MAAELGLVTQLAIILIAAGVFTVIFKALGQPVILGYIVAGFIVGPHLGLFPQFSPESVKQWSELGIIFMLFGLGLEFNFKKLLGVGGPAIITALTACLGMVFVGFILGNALGWKTMECIFLGGMLSMSSTAIVLKAYDDLGLKNSSHSPLLFGMLVVEDLLAVLMLVLFNTIAVSNQVSGSEMILSLAKLIAFLVLCFLVGIYVLPSLLKKAKPYLNDEILLLISVGLCFVMVILANLAGFSSALGAFLIGSILSSTVEGEQIEKVTIDIKNLFGAIFFVSVGMMVDPVVIGKYWSVILIITLVFMVGMVTLSSAGVLLSGKDLKTAVNVGFSLPQIGEFSFIIAGLGMGLGVLSDFIYPIIIAVSVITTFVTPYMIKASAPVYSFLEKKLPAGLKEKLDRNSSDNAASASSSEKNLWLEFFKKYLLRIGIYSLLCLTVLIGCYALFPSAETKLFPKMSELARNIIGCVVTLALLTPFLFGLARNSSELSRLGGNLVRKSNNARIPLILSYVFRIILVLFFVLSTILSYVHLNGWNILIALSAIPFVLLAWKINSRSYMNMEDKFFKNLNEKETQMRKKARVASAVKDKMGGHDISIKAVQISSDFAFAGKTLREMPFRHKSGVNIVKIQRGSREILIPGGDEVILPADRVLAVGTSVQLSEFEEIVKENTILASEEAREDFVVESISLEDGNELIGESLAQSNMRSFGCMVMSVVRGDMTYTNPKPDFVFCEGDILWMAGKKSAVDWFSK